MCYCIHDLVDRPVKQMGYLWLHCHECSRNLWFRSIGFICAICDLACVVPILCRVMYSTYIPMCTLGESSCSISSDSDSSSSFVLTFKALRWLGSQCLVVWHLLARIRASPSSFGSRIALRTIRSSQSSRTGARDIFTLCTGRYPSIGWPCPHGTMLAPVSPVACLVLFHCCSFGSPSLGIEQLFYRWFEFA